ncbi:MAG: YciI family protein [candidate division Zixibacteria bacterium]|nr:YciI family protein [candidate division Zixibacteria bacterium]
MKYLCLLYHDEKAGEALSESEMKGFLGEVSAFGEEIKKSGHHLASQRLRPARTATIIRNRNGRVIVTDGPFAETKEQLGGFYLIEAADHAEALQVASKIPATRWGTVELRPVMEPAGP